MGTGGGALSPTLRGGAVLVCEVVSLSALGASLAWLMWSAVEPVGPLPNTRPAGERGIDSEAIQARLDRLPAIAMAGGSGPPGARTGTSITLHATRAGLTGQGAAIVSVDGGAQQSFAVGQAIAPGVRLALVAGSYIEIDTSGRIERLEFADAQRQPVFGGEPAPPENASPAATPAADLASLGASELLPGDVLLKIDGVDAANANLASYASQLQAGRTFEVVFERDGRIAAATIGNPAP